MQIYVIICHTLQLFYNCIGQTIHTGSLRISRENTVKIFVIFRTDTAASLFKFLSADRFYKDHSSIHLLRLQLICKLYRCLDPHILSGMDRGRDQNCFSGITAADHCIGKGKFSSCQPQKTALLCSRFCPKRVFCLLQLFLLFFCADHKHRGRMIIQLLFLAPHSLPDIQIYGNGLKSNLF